MSENQKTRGSGYEIDMINGPLLSKIIVFFVPLLLSGILQLLFNAVDLIVVGNFAGSDALAAVGATTAIINMFSSAFIGISLGANVVCAGYIARKDNFAVSETVHTSITIAAIMGLVMMLFGILMAPFSLKLMGTPDNIIDQSILYMRIYFGGMPFMIVYNYGSAVLRAAGDTRRPLYFLVAAGIINAGLNLVMVIVFSLGVAGVAIATVFSQMVSCILVLTCLARSHENYRLDIRKLHINTDIAGKIFSIGIPAAVQSVVINFSNVLLQSSVNNFGSVSVAGYTAANNLFGFMFVSIDAIAQACMSFTGQNYAVLKMDRVKSVLKDCMLLTFAVAMAMGAVFYIFGPEILSIYNSDPEVIEAGMKILSYTTLTYFLCGFMNCLPGALRGMAYSTVPMILSIIGTVGVRIIWIYVFFPMNRTLDFLFLSYPVSWIITCVMQAVCLIVIFRKSGVSA